MTPIGQVKLVTAQGSNEIHNLCSLEDQRSNGLYQYNGKTFTNFSEKSAHLSIEK